MQFVDHTCEPLFIKILQGWNLMNIFETPFYCQTVWSSTNMGVKLKFELSISSVAACSHEHFFLLKLNLPCVV